ncbi:unnamed protein product (macronuclear) [Paramecium tetraurelia]|uniref:EF-hand domain-containing protein n=1 Tax=Paramecium tetraurelia TaxID=5888 RepID=A0DLT3_PARTE|nr:uncharacterized protein GSPATT00039632001 [Paramecium tetraurelia]CAK84000.1 unnamed protein product [Paramecium tetraurelia]|eukprot:XP_001451397.1 hypothetical protein (macronuclear) [Paramecium tetraurelia strain d4-2]
MQQEIEVQSPDHLNKSQSNSKSKLNSQGSSQNLNSPKDNKSNEILSKEHSRNQSLEKGHQDGEQNEELIEHQEMQQEQDVVSQQVVQPGQEQEQDQNKKDLAKKKRQRISILNNAHRAFKGKEQKVSQTSFTSFSPDSTPDPISNNRQSKFQLSTQKQLEMEEQEKKDENLRVKLIEWLKTEFMFKQIHPFDLFTALDDPNAEFLLRQSELEQAFKYVNIEIGEDNYRIINKYYKVKDGLSTLKLCYHIVDDQPELMFMALNHIIIKYRILVDIFFDEITQSEKLFTADSLKLLNKEWEWGFEEKQMSVVHNLMTDYGNSSMNFQLFKQKLQQSPQAVDSSLNLEMYQSLVNLIIQDDSVMTFSLLLQDQDQASSGEVALYIFIDILSMYIDRALSKIEMNAIRIFLQVEKDEEVVAYNKLLTDALKIIENQKTLRLQQTAKIQKFQLQLMLLYFNSIDNLSQLQEQYFKEKNKISKDHFIKQTIQVTNGKVDKESANAIFQMIQESKLDQKSFNITDLEFDQFIKKKKHELSISDKTDQINSPLNQEQFKELYELQRNLNKKSLNRLSAQIIMSPKSSDQSNQNSPDKLDLKQVQGLLSKQSQQKEVVQEQQIKQEEKAQISTQQLKMDIYQYFEDLDTIQLKYLTQQQMFFGLLKLGILIKGQTLMQQKSYDYGGFEKFVLLQLKTFYNSQKLIYLLKQEFDQYKEAETEVVNMQQLKQLFEKVNLNVKFEDVIFIYQTLDRERSGYINLEDFFYLIHQHPLIEYRLNELLFRMKGYYENSLRAQRIFYQKMPFNYIRPFSIKANPPSSSFRFKPDVLGKFQVEQKGKAWNVYKVKILSGEGIPSPEDKKSCFRREVVVGIYDKFYKEFVENTVIVKAKYNEENEDIWEFPSRNRSNGFFLNCEKKHNDLHLILLFELISYYLENGVVQKVSCGFVEIPFSHIIQQGTFDLPLKGGIIEQEIAINRGDVRCKRGGFASLAAKIKGEIIPHLTISSAKRSRRPALLIELETLPPLCLCHRNMTQIVYAYKRFARDILEEEGEVYIQSLNMFLFSLDCPYINNRICRLWINTIKGKMIGKEKSVFSILIGQLQKLMKMKAFSFNPYSPQEIFPPEVGKQKKDIVKSVLLNTEFLIDSSFENKLNLPGDKILEEQIQKFGEMQEQGIFDNGQNPFDPYKNGLNLKGYEPYVEQII